MEEQKTTDLFGNIKVANGRSRKTVIKSRQKLNINNK